MQLLEYLNDHIVYLDGPLGTSLQRRGLPRGVRGENWNYENPEAVIDMHMAYFKAGSNIVCTNTFGANRFHYGPEELEKVIALAVSHVKEARRRSRCEQPTWIALKMSSLGKLIKPLGDLEFEDAVAAYAEIVKLGVKYGVDLIDIETMNDSYETKAALLAVKENCDLPVFVSNTYDASGHLMSGATPEAMVAMLEGMRADAIGINCSLGPAQLQPILDRYLEAASVPVYFRPNAGLPQMVNGQTVYDITPGEWADEVVIALKKGAHMAGGCCGTTEEFIATLVERSAGVQAVPVTDKGLSRVSSFKDVVTFGGAPILNAERVNPNALEEIKEAIRTGDVNRIKQEVLLEKAEGAHIIDLNVGLPEIDEPSFLREVVKEVQAVCDLPLVMDTSDPAAMEAALRCYNGKALIDTVNGKEENMDAIFPLAAKYGGMIVCLPIDEDGIPAKAEDRVKIVEKIVARAAEYGIGKKELIVDPLAMTISTDTHAALETLKALKIVHEMGIKTSLGVSNISFGLPRRPLLNAQFFAMALDAGLDTGIVNTGSKELMNVYYTYCALHDYDENCLNYLKYCASLPEEAEVSAPADAVKPVESNEEPGQSELALAIIDGMDDDAVEIARKMLETEEPLKIISDHIIPALDYVGKGFEEQEFFLPELLMSAEAAQQACALIKEHMSASGTDSGTKCAFVLATVQGDVHDIGKNIVKILLENYGYEVHDVGIDAPPELIVEKVVETHAPFCGLSALMTTSVPPMEETIKQLAEKAPWCKVVVGGAVMNQEYADQIHAHAYGSDAMATVRFADQNLEA